MDASLERDVSERSERLGVRRLRIAPALRKGHGDGLGLGGGDPPHALAQAPGDDGLAPHALADAGTRRLRWTEAALCPRLLERGLGSLHEGDGIDLLDGDGLRDGDGLGILGQTLFFRIHLHA